MPLTTLLEGRELDATACTAEEWRAIHRQRPRRALVCRVCGASMHAKVSKRGLRHFAHDKRQVDCSASGESLEHLRLKSLVAGLVRHLGYRAEVEVASASDGEAWRADVIAYIPDGRRVAFEIQLSGMTLDAGRHRTNRYRADGIATVWLSSGHPSWMCQLPSLRISYSNPDEPLVDRGVARLQHNRWVSRGEGPLVDVMADILKGDMRPTEIDGKFVEKTISDAGESTVALRTHTTNDATVLVSRSELETYQSYRAHQQQQQQEHQAKREEEERNRSRHQTNIEAAKLRREELLQYVVRGVEQTLRPEERIWLGGEDPRLWDGRFPVFLEFAFGAKSSAHGAVVSIGSVRAADGARIVICPTASLCGTAMGTTWKLHGVRVAAQKSSEARWIAHALGWRAHEVELIDKGWTLERQPHTPMQMDGYFGS